MIKQMSLWGIQTCDCGQTATITQETIYGEEHYCNSCYDDMTQEKEESQKELA